MNENDPGQAAGLAALEELLAALAAARAERRLEFYHPYDKQRAFHEAGATRRERLFMAGNQLGKTLAGAMEMALHLTGDYPDWWRGRRFAGPVAAWAASNTTETTRNNPQRALLGIGAENWGQAAIPKQAIIRRPAARAGAVPDALDSVLVRHASGGVSRLAFKSYDQGREKWQGPPLDLVWMDEEPPAAIYSEALARTNATGGMAFITFTPLLGMSEVVGRFIAADHPDRWYCQMRIEEAGHISPAQRARILAATPAHELDARTRGIPMLGSGRIFPVAEDAITCPAFALPEHWAQLGAIDFGWDHPTAAVRLFWDRDGDVLYVADCHRLSRATPIIHAATLKGWGEGLMFAWPQDGLQADKGSGRPLAEQYRAQGLSMLAEPARFADGSVSVEAGILALLERMQTGRFKVFAHLADWFEEFRIYHRKDGRVVAERDDLLAATRYGLMCLRHARPIKRGRVLPRETLAGYDVLSR